MDSPHKALVSNAEKFLFDDVIICTTGHSLSTFTELMRYQNPIVLIGTQRLWRLIYLYIYTTML